MEKIKFKITAKEVCDRIHTIHGNTLTMDIFTYSGMKNKAKFVDIQYGEHWMLPYTVIRGGCHPIRGRKKSESSRAITYGAKMENGLLVRICIKCSDKKEENLFHFNTSAKKYNNVCSDCWHKNRNESNANNLERNTAVKKAWAKRNKNKVIEARKKWKEENIGKVKADKARQKERVKQATPKWLSPLQLAAIEHAYFMADLRSQCFDDRYHVDHVIPLRGENVCGLNVPWNLEVIKASENLQKGNKLLSWRLKS
jgi:hypothetical protein